MAAPGLAIGASDIFWVNQLQVQATTCLTRRLKTGERPTCPGRTAPRYICKRMHIELFPEICFGVQAALLREGCYPGEEEMEDWLFGDGTYSALLTFQASCCCVHWCFCQWHNLCRPAAAQWTARTGCSSHVAHPIETKAPAIPPPLPYAQMELEWHCAEDACCRQHTKSALSPGD